MAKANYETMKMEDLEKEILRMRTEKAPAEERIALRDVYVRRDQERYDAHIADLQAKEAAKEAGKQS